MLQHRSELENRLHNISTNDKLSQNYIDLQQECELYQHDIQSLRYQLHELDGNIAELQYNNNLLHQQNHRLVEQQQNHKYNELQQEYDTVTNTNNDLLHSNTELVISNNTLQQELDTMHDSYRTLQLDYSKLQSDYNNINNTRYSTNPANISRYSGVTGELKYAVVDTLQQHVDTLTSTNKQLQNQYDTLKSDHDTLIAETITLQQQHKNQVESTPNQLINQSVQINQFKLNATEQQRQPNVAGDEVLGVQLISLQRQNDMLNESIVQHKTNASQQSDIIQSLNQLVANSTHEYKLLENVLCDTRQQLTVAQRQVDELQQYVESVHNTHTVEQQQLRHTIQQLKQTESDQHTLDATQLELSDTLRQLDQAKQQLAQQQNTIDSLTQQIQSINELHTQSNNDRLIVQNKLIHAETQLTGMNDQLNEATQQYTNKLHSYQTTIESLTDERTELQQQLVHALSDTKVLMDQFDAIQSQHNDVLDELKQSHRDDIDTYESTIESHAATMDQQQNTLQSVTDQLDAVSESNGQLQHTIDQLNQQIQQLNNELTTVKQLALPAVDYTEQFSQSLSGTNNSIPSTPSLRSNNTAVPQTPDYIKQSTNQLKCAVTDLKHAMNINTPQSSIQSTPIHTIPNYTIPSPSYHNQSINTPFIDDNSVMDSALSLQDAVQQLKRQVKVELDVSIASNINQSTHPLDITNHENIPIDNNIFVSPTMPLKKTLPHAMKLSSGSNKSNTGSAQSSHHKSTVKSNVTTGEKTRSVTKPSNKWLR